MSTTQRSNVTRGCGNRSVSATRLISTAVITLVAFSEPVLAQDDVLNFRGFSFDPAEFETATPGEWADIGVAPPLQLPPSSESGIAPTDPGWKLLQIGGPVDRTQRRALRAENLRLDMPLGGGYLEFVSDAQVARLRSDRLIRAAVPYQPAFKLPPYLRSGAFAQDESRFVTEGRRRIEGLYLELQLFPRTSVRSLRDRIRRMSGVITAEAPPNLVSDDAPTVGDAYLYVTVTTEDALFGIASMQEVRSISEVGEIVYDNAGAAAINQSGSKKLASVWDNTLHGEDQVVAILDHGLPKIDSCYLHDPANAIGTNHRKIVHTRDQSGTGGDPIHSTFVAASLAGDNLNNPGQDPARGGAWAARLALGNTGDIDPVTKYPLPPLTTLEDQFVLSSAHAYIHSNSWHFGLGNPAAGYSRLAQETDRFSRENDEHLVIASAGYQGGIWGPPGIAKNALTVAAAKKSNAMEYAEGMTSITPAGRKKPDISAIGCDLSSASSELACGTIKDSWCSTSFATPHVAALAALVRQYFMEGWYPTGTKIAGNSKTPTGALLKATLINSAQDMTSEPPAPNNQYPSQKEGWGIVTLDRALYFAKDTRKLLVWDVRTSPTTGLDTNETHTYRIEVTDSSEALQATLVWMDYESEVNDGGLKNNLDLALTGPVGLGKYRGNHFDTVAGETPIGGTADAANNVEQVLVNGPAIGSWQIEVTASLIQSLDVDTYGQGYALVVTGAVEKEPPKIAWLPPAVLGLISVLILGRLATN